MMYNQDLLDIIQIVSFVVGVQNYKENLTQNDKDDIMNHLDKQTKEILIGVKAELERQNAMLEEILKQVKKWQDQE